MGTRCGIAREQAVAIAFAPGEEIRVVDQAIFDDFGIAGAGFAGRQAVERGGVDQDQRGLVEAADQIFARAGVDRGLAADRRIDLGQQGGGQLHEMAAALEDGGGKADEVANDPAAQRDDMVAAFDLQREQGVEQLLQMPPALGLFARRQDDGFDPDIGGAQAGVEPGQLGCGDVGVRDDDEPAAPGEAGKLVPGAIERALFDQDVVAARVQRDLD